ncbi:MAG: MFS transporter [Oleiphilaceae bacterium]|nr:MFS transporter [Oleiphilaceae bacterium]
MRNNSGFYLSQGFDVLSNNLCKQGFLFVLAFFSTHENHSLVLANVALTVYILPFLFLSYFAGTHAEPRNKRRLIRQLKLLDLLLVSLVALSYAFEAVWLTLLMIALLGCKTAIMTPVKFAYMSERYQGNALLRSNALMQTMSLTCMLIAITSAGFILEQMHHPLEFGYLLIVISVLGLISSGLMQNSQPRHIQHSEPMRVRKLLSEMHEYGLWPNIILVAWFWFISALFVSQFINFIKLELAGSPAIAATALAIVVAGMLSGAVILEWFKPRKLGFVILSGMSLSALTSGIALYAPDDQGVHHISAFFTSGLGLSALLFATGVFATSYIAPAYTRLQHASPSDKVARIMGISSIVNALLICMSTAFAYLILELLELGLQLYFFAIGLINLLFFATLAWWLRKTA